MFEEFQGGDAEKQAPPDAEKQHHLRRSPLKFQIFLTRTEAKIYFATAIQFQTNNLNKKIFFKIQSPHIYVIEAFLLISARRCTQSSAQCILYTDSPTYTPNT